MKLYNTLTRSTKEFKPIKAGKVSLYTCGPTVYDHVHIGNLRTYILEDVLRRALRSNDFDVLHVMNITDVDDKTIIRSRQTYADDKPIEALTKLTCHYEKIFYEDADKVGIDFNGSRVVKATDNINDMQELIRQIPTKYVSDDGVYFDIEKYNDYGALLKLDRAHAHHRINNDEYDKEHVADFALWKVKQTNEPSWDFEIDGKRLDGRPGWHIECSAMSVKYLGQPFDIHTGGVDLIFPHHENEIAQSRAATNLPLANYFVHAEHLLVDGRKMSKSLKNFYILDDISAKKIEPLAFRLLVLQSHYRHQMNFTWQALDGAQAFLDRLRAWADLRFQPHLGHKKIAGNSYGDTFGKIKDALGNDLDTPRALAELSDLALRSEKEGVDIPRLKSLLSSVDELLGLRLLSGHDISHTTKELIAKREAARSAQQWSKADELRDQLLGNGLEINDTPHGPLWSRFRKS